MPNVISQIATQLPQPTLPPAIQAAGESLPGLVEGKAYVGEAVSLGYSEAILQIHNFHRQQAGGIPALCFLLRRIFGMKVVTQVLTALLLGTLMSGCVRRNNAERSPESLDTINHSQFLIMQHILETIDQQIPELNSMGITKQPSMPATEGEQRITAGFALSKSPRHPPVELPAMKGRPFLDVGIAITRYSSSKSAQQALEKSLFLRPIAPPPRRTYRDNLLYHYENGPAICQSGQYIVEVSPYSKGGQALTMTVLGVVLDGLKSAASKSK